MIIVAGQILVEPEQREAYLQSCVEVTQQARDAPGCLDFALTAAASPLVASTYSSAGNRQRRYGPFAATVPAKTSRPK
jgi:quinol monooxygenase YgiN